MKLLFIFIIACSLSFNKAKNVSKEMPLNGKTIIIDPGHGGKDPGTSHKDILEKNINLQISKILKKDLLSNGAKVILTREDDYDLSSPNVYERKKSDFNNRINLINNYGDLYLSIHLNYLTDKKYFGGQVFYDQNNKELALIIQESFNKILKSNREIKHIPDLYMYKRLNIPGVLIECGFLSNSNERELLVNEDYQKKISFVITSAIKNYYSSKL